MAQQNGNSTPKKVGSVPFPKLAIAFSKKFALFLFKNNHLNEYFLIEKEVARPIFDEFKKSWPNVKVAFGEVVFYTKQLKSFNKKVFCYSSNELLSWDKKQTQIDSILASASNIKKKLVVSQNFSLSKVNTSKQHIPGTKCFLCNTPAFQNEHQLQVHFSSKEHRFLDDFSKLEKTSRKNPLFRININNSPNINNLVLRKNEQTKFSLQLENLRKHTVIVTAAQINQEDKRVTLSANIPSTANPKRKIQWIISIDCKNENIITFPVILTCSSDENTQKWAFKLVFHAHDEFYDDLHPTEPYKPFAKPILREYIESTESGEKVEPRRKRNKRALPLKPYPLNPSTIVVLNAGLKEFEGMLPKYKEELTRIQSLLDVPDKKNSLTVKNYNNLLDCLLYLEEHQMMKNIRDYDKEDQALIKAGNYLQLQVPGLAENRPSLVITDSVFVRESKNSTKLYEGVVHQVKECSVFLKFSRNFHEHIYSPSKRFYVHFSFNRYPLRVQHQAVELAKRDNIIHLLFPIKINNNPQQLKALNYLKSSVKPNVEQQLAIQAVLNKTSTPYPYLIFGPPGTGKTLTVVESVKQIFTSTQEKILICTPSNSAANEITGRLTGIMNNGEMFRLVAPSFPPNHIPSNIKKYCNIDPEGYYQPPMNEILQYRVVIVTLSSAAKLVNGGCPFRHFDYLFIDEAGQATESETLVPIAGLLSNAGQIFGHVVLIGDPEQLGAVIQSTLAMEMGFDRSMLERLMKTGSAYKKNENREYNPNALTKLVKNYRSHEVIINRPNEFFYDNDLTCCGDDSVNLLVGWAGLPNKKFPMIFHSVVGMDQRESDSPSFFNIQEIEVLMNYLDRLINKEMKGVKIQEKHIGVISPYKKQIDKLKKACNKKKYSQLLIGTVEQIQGQEKEIIIISTVRSTAQFESFDEKFHLGFLKNPKRLNVAITRAKALLIIIGNPNLLQFDKYWRGLIEYCMNNSAMVGDQFELIPPKEENN